MRGAALAAASLLVAAIAVAPIDPAFADATRDAQWHLKFLDVAEAQRITSGQGVTVAVIDTGVADHPDLRRNVLPGTVTLLDGHGDGRQDRDGHGTGMAGLIAAEGHGNGGGALGIAPAAKILPINAVTGDGRGDSDNVAVGIEWAMAHGATVVSISIHGGPTPRLREAVARAQHADIIVVAGVGNRPRNTGIGFPAYYPGVVAVGASNKEGSHASTSVTGRGVMLLAPGVDITSTGLNGGYRKGTGTSDSTAIVAGAVALIRSKYPDLSAKEVVHRLEATAIDKGPPGLDDQYGYGILNLVGALTADVPPLTPSPNDGPTADASPSVGVATGPSADSGFVLTMTVLILVVIAAVGAFFAIRSRARRRREDVAR